MNNPYSNNQYNNVYDAVNATVPTRVPGNLSNNRHPVLQATDVIRDLNSGAGAVRVLKGITFTIYQGERVGIIGPSGSGKSTLLGLMGGLDNPTQGKIEIDGIDITRLNESRSTEVRNEKIGFVFQFFNLVPTLTALENVMLPIEFAKKAKFPARKRAADLLTMIGLGDRLHHRPSQLSGGQQQRVAIARALANNPPLLLADEPTGNLDTESGQLVLNMLSSVQRDMGTTIVIVTHDQGVASTMDRVLTLIDGRLVESR